jgi:two-component system LytT family response regulator
MLKVLLIDDEERATDALRLMIEKMVPEIKQVFVCNDSRKAAEMIHACQPGLIFLDIQMPDLTGFEVIEQLTQKPNIIFTTAYEQYAIKAFETFSIDYLLKPIKEERIQQRIEKL